MKFRVAIAFQEDVGDVVFLDGLPRFFRKTQNPLEFLDLRLVACHDPDMVQPKFLPRNTHHGISLTGSAFSAQQGGLCSIVINGVLIERDTDIKCGFMIVAPILYSSDDSDSHLAMLAR